MASKNLFAIAGANSFNALTPSSPDPLGYATGLTQKSAVDLLEDNVFLNDAADHYYETEGKQFYSNEELIEYFLSDRRSGNFNTIGIVDDLIDAYSSSDRVAARQARLQRVYEALPNFIDGISGFGEVLGEVILDPVNLIGFGAAGVAARAAGAAVREGVKGVSKEAIKQASRKGMVAGAKRGALAEAAVNAGIEGVFDAGLQARDIELGIQDEYSIARGLTSTAAGGFLGGTLGAVGGAIAGRGAGRKGFDIADKILNKEAADARLAALKETAPVATEEVGLAMGRALDRAQEAQTRVNEYLDNLPEEVVLAGRAAIKDPVLTALEAEARALREIANFPQREPEIQARIKELAAVGDEKSLAAADVLYRDLATQRSLFQRVSAEVDDPLALERDVASAAAEYNAALRDAGAATGIEAPQVAGSRAAAADGPSPRTAGNAAGANVGVIVDQPAPAADAPVTTGDAVPTDVVIPEGTEIPPGLEMNVGGFVGKPNTVSLAPLPDAPIRGDFDSDADFAKAQAVYDTVVAEQPDAIAFLRKHAGPDRPQVDIDNLTGTEAPDVAGPYVLPDDLAASSKDFLNTTIKDFNKLIGVAKRKRTMALKKDANADTTDLDSEIVFGNTEVERLRDALKNTPAAPDPTPPVRVAAITAFSSPDRVASSDQATSIKRITAHLKLLGYNKDGLKWAAASLRKIAGASPDKVTKIASFREFIRTEILATQSADIFDEISAGHSTNVTLSKDGFAAYLEVEVQVIGLSDDMITAIHDRHSEFIKKNSDYILRQPFIDQLDPTGSGKVIDVDNVDFSKIDLDLAFEGVEEIYGAGTRALVEEALGEPRVGIQNMKLPTSDEQRAAQALVNKRISTATQDAMIEALKVKYPHIKVMKELQRLALEHLLVVAQRQEREAAAGIKTGAIGDQATAAAGADIRSKKIFKGVTEPIDAVTKKARADKILDTYTRLIKKLRDMPPGDSRSRLEDKIDNLREDYAATDQDVRIITGSSYERGLGQVNVVIGKKGAIEDHDAGILRALDKRQAMFQESDEHGILGAIGRGLVRAGLRVNESGVVVRDPATGKGTLLSSAQAAHEALGNASLRRKSKTRPGVTLKEIDELNKLINPEAFKVAVETVEAMRKIEIDAGRSRPDTIAVIDKRLEEAGFTEDERFSIHASVLARREKGQEELDRLSKWYDENYSEHEIQIIRNVEGRDDAIKRNRKISRQHSKKKWREKQESLAATDPDQLDAIAQEIAQPEVATSRGDGNWSRSIVADSEEVIGHPYSPEALDDVLEKASTLARSKAVNDTRLERSRLAVRAFEDHLDSKLLEEELADINASAATAARAPQVGDTQKPSTAVNQPKMVVHDGIEIDLANDFLVTQVDDNNFKLHVLGKQNAASMTVAEDGSWTFTWLDSESGEVTKVFRSTAEMKANWSRIFRGDVIAALNDGRLTNSPLGGEGVGFEIDWRESARYSDVGQVSATKRVTAPVDTPLDTTPAADWQHLDLHDLAPAQLGLPEGRVLAIQMRGSKGAPVRVINTRGGQTIAAILGKRGVKTEYTIGHVRSDLHSHPSGITASMDFVPLFPEDPVVRAAGADVPKHQGEAPSTNTKAIHIDKLHTVELKQFSLPEDLRGADNLRTLQDLHNQTLRLENFKWDEIPDINVHIKTLATFYGIIAEHAPNGITMRNSSRIASTNQLIKITQGRPDADVAAMLGLLDGISTGSAATPTFRAGAEPSFTPPAASARARNARFEGNDITLSPSEAVPGVIEMVHEVGHWGYLNILSPEDRMVFWTHIRDTLILPDGTVDRALLEQKLPGLSPNRLDSPAEFFANQFSQWAVSRGRSGLRPDRIESLWRRFAEMTSQFIRRFVNKEEIDISPELQGLFERILPDQETAHRFDHLLARAKDKPGALTAAQQLIHFQEWRSDITKVMSIDSVTAKMEALDTISRGIYAKFGGVSGEATHRRFKRGGAPVKRVMILDGIGERWGIGIKGRSARRARATLLHAFRNARDFINSQDGGASETGTRPEFNTGDLTPEVRELMRSQAEEMNADLNDSVDISFAEVDQILDDSYVPSDMSSGSLKSQWEPMVELVQEGLSPDSYDEMAAIDLQLFSLDLALYRGQVEFRRVFRRTTRTDKSRGISVASDGVPTILGLSKPNPYSAKAKGLRKYNASRTLAKEQREVQAAWRNIRLEKTGVDIDPNGPNVRVKSQTRAQIEAELRGKPMGDARAKAQRTRLAAIARADPELEPPHGDIPEGILNADNRILNSMLQVAIDIGDQDVKLMVYRTLKHNGQHFLGTVNPKTVQTSMVGRAIRIEMADDVGIPRVNGIPANVTASIEEVLLRGTHRDPDIERSTRTVLYRLLNLQGKAGRDALNNATFMDLDALYRISGGKPKPGTRAGVLDMSDPVVNGAIKRVRRFAVGLHKERGDPLDLMHEIGHMTMESTFTERDLANIATSFQEALQKGDRLALKIVEKYDSKSTEQLSKEWFVEGYAQYLGERISRGDIYKVRQGEQPLVLKGTLETLVDRLVEYVSYILNGLIGRRSIRQQYRELTYFGDMFLAARTPHSSLDAVASSGYPAVVPPSMAAPYAFEAVSSMSPAKSLSVRGFVGADSNEPLERHILYASDLSQSQRVDPDIPLQAADPTAPYGEGVYLRSANDIDPAGDAYDLDRIKDLIDASEPNSLRRERGHVLAKSISGNAAAIQRVRRDITAAQHATPRDEPHLAGKRSHLARLVAEDRVLWNELATQAGIPGTPHVAPMVARVTNTFDFSERATYSFGGDRGSIIYFTNGLENAGILNADAHIRLMSELPETFSGRDLYEALTTRSMIGDGYAGDAVDARARLTEYLKDNDYDSISASDGDHSALIVFDPASVRHINDRQFDTNPSQVQASLSLEPESARLGGSLLAELVGTPGATLDPRNFGPMAVELQRLGVPKAVTQVMRKMHRGDVLTDADTQAVHKFGKGIGRGSYINLSKNSDYLRRGGAQWLADFIQPANGVGFYERHGSEVGKQIVPLLQALQDLPDAGNFLTRWATKLNPYSTKEPASHSKIARWLIGNDNIKLSTQEKEVAELINNRLQEELLLQQRAGVIIGDIRNRPIKRYLRQVWDVDTMKNDPAGYQEAFSRWFIEDEKKRGLNLSQEDAKTRADRMYRNMVDDDGVADFGASDSSIRRALLIDWDELSRLNPKLYKELDGFLVKDLYGNLSKYFDASVRRRLMAPTMGEGDQAFNAYLAVSIGGRNGTMAVLRRGRTLGRPEYARADIRFDTGGRVNISHNVFHAIAQSEGHAAQIYSDLMDAINAGGTSASARRKNKEAAKQVLLSAYGDTTQYNTNPQFKARINAIIGGLADFGDPTKLLPTSGGKFMEGIMRSVHRRSPAGEAAGDATLHGASQIMRTFNSVTLLGWTTLTSIPDVALPLIRSGNMGAFVKAWGKFMTDPAYRRASRRIGASIENLISDRMSNMHSSYGNKLQHAFFNGTLLTPWTNIMREVAAIVAHEAMISEAARAQRLIREGRINSAAYRTTRRFLKRYGVERYGEPGGPSLERDLKRIGDDPKGEFNDVRYGIHRFVNESIFTPNPNDIPAWALTPWGSLIFQLKSFPLMMGRMVIDISKEFAKGNVAPLSYLFTAGAGFGAASMAIKDIAQSRSDDPDKTFRDRSITKITDEMGFGGILVPGNKNFDKILGWYVEGLIAAGGLGLIGEMLWNAAEQSDSAFGKQRVASMLAGPWLGTVGDAITVGFGAHDVIQGNDKNYPERAAARTVASRIPVFGGQREFREMAANLAGEVKKKGGTRQSSKFGTTFSNRGFGGGF